MQKKLLLAIQSGDIETVRSELKHLSPDIPLTTYLQTPLHMAARQGNYELVKCLATEFGANVNSTDCNGWTPLGHIAVIGDPSKYNIAQLLISLGADVDFSNRDSCYYSPFDFAKDNRDDIPDIFQLFLLFSSSRKIWKKCKGLLFLYEAVKVKVF
jgi:ankyrin repeat protein